MDIRSTGGPLNVFMFGLLCLLAGFIFLDSAADFLRGALGSETDLIKVDDGPTLLIWMGTLSLTYGLTKPGWLVVLRTIACVIMAVGTGVITWRLYALTGVFDATSCLCLLAIFVCLGGAMLVFRSPAAQDNSDGKPLRPQTLGSIVYIGLMLAFVSLQVMAGDWVALIWLLIPIAAVMQHYKAPAYLSYVLLFSLFVTAMVRSFRDVNLESSWQIVTQNWLTSIVILFLPVFFGLYAAYVWWEKRQMARK